MQTSRNHAEYIKRFSIAIRGSHCVSELGIEANARMERLSQAAPTHQAFRSRRVPSSAIGAQQSRRSSIQGRARYLSSFGHSDHGSGTGTGGRAQRLALAAATGERYVLPRSPFALGARHAAMQCTHVIRLQAAVQFKRLAHLVCPCALVTP